MSAGKLDLVIEQGSDYFHQLIWQNVEEGTPIDITGYTAKMQIRPCFGSDDIYEELSTANGKITIVGADGKILLELTNAVTTAYTWVNGVYDLELTSTVSKITRLIEGKVTITKNLTI